MTTRLLSLVLVFAAAQCSGQNRAAAQLPGFNLEPIAESFLQNSAAADGAMPEQQLLNAFADSWLVDAFPLLRTLIDLLTELLDLLNQADQFVSGVNGGDNGKRRASRSARYGFARR